MICENGTRTFLSTLWSYRLLQRIILVFGLFSLVGAVGCVERTSRACKVDTDCAESAPHKYCLEGFCSQQQCKPGAQQSCYEGALDNLGKGACRAGQRVCNQEGFWSACQGQILARPEICDREDNDCDGKIDEDIDCSCKPGEQQLCYNGPVNSQGKGGCQAGLQSCGQDNLWGHCLAQKLPQVEICDNLDNDCDGQVDNGLQCDCKPGEKRPCFTGITGCVKRDDGTYSCTGLCQSGQQVCGTNNRWGSCDKMIAPVAEVCDGKDNDCDGQVDETCGCPQPGLQEKCYTGDPKEINTPNTTCRQGHRVCLASGQWSECFGQVKPTEEVCNGKDDNCDGQIDEVFPEKGQECVVVGAKGPCSSGIRHCEQGKVICQAQVRPQSQEICGNGTDDDCDGRVDQAPPCACTPGQSQACYSGGSGCVKEPNGRWVCQGSCQAGTQFCQVDGTWSACVGEAVEKKEICDGKDNNCDGKVDEVWPKRGQVCQVGRGACARTGQWQCLADGSDLVCSVGPGPASPESCDGVDNDCDGQIDEDLRKICFSGAFGLLGKGECRSGVQVCEQGNWSACQGQVAPQSEMCDNQDNDCNGQVDEKLVKQCYTGLSQTEGVGECKGGFQVCRAGKWSPCVSQVLPTIEVCDGKDNDCDGKIDESLQRFCYEGAAGTINKGLCRGGIQVCVAGKWGECVGQVRPATEVCDGKDNNCDGQIDEALQKTCYSGPSGTASVGACRAGYQTCLAGTWSGCLQQVTPTTEVCDNKDNNCDGVVDEGCVCKPGETQSCGSNVGTCKAGQQTCTSHGLWGACVGEIKPTTEVCDGKDNNCDGRVDEIWPHIGLPCTVGQSACQRTGKYVCKADGSGTECSVKPAAPTPEVCDAIDNDCDGKVDEELQRSCYDGPGSTQNKGACRDGIQQCASGQWGACLNQVKPSTEVCDGQDNDCNGQIDENLTRTCYSGPQGTRGWGLCKAGTSTCSAGTWSACQGEVSPQPEVCDNQDNDCNGKVDDGLQRSCYTGPSGTNGKGICHSGVQACVTGTWGTCQGEVTPQTEICDGKDNDCDGMIDNGNPGGGKACSTGSPGVCAQGMEVCQAGQLICQATQTPSTEVCDGKDNNCDGKIDENLTQSCTNSCGVGTQVCQNGTWAKNCVRPQRSEQCDRIDNDCDGLIDEGCDCGECQTDDDCKGGGLQGVCVQGYCYKKANGNRCNEPFIKDATSNLCIPPDINGTPLWTCKQYLNYGKNCSSTSDCGGGDSQAKTGATCQNSSCRLYCRHKDNCPSGGYNCNSDICYPN